MCKRDRWKDSPTVTWCDQKIRETNGSSSLVASASPGKFLGQVQNHEVLQTDQKAFISPDGNNTVGPQWSWTHTYNQASLSHRGSQGKQCGLGAGSLSPSETNGPTAPSLPRPRARVISCKHQPSAVHHHKGSPWEVSRFHDMQAETLVWRTWSRGESYRLPWKGVEWSWAFHSRAPGQRRQEPDLSPRNRSSTFKVIIWHKIILSN